MGGEEIGWNRRGGEKERMVKSREWEDKGRKRKGGRGLVICLHDAPGL